MIIYKYYVIFKKNFFIFFSIFFQGKNLYKDLGFDGWSGGPGVKFKVNEMNEMLNLTLNLT